MADLCQHSVNDKFFAVAYNRAASVTPAWSKFALNVITTNM